MNFGQALEQVKKGKGMRLSHWDKGIVIYNLQNKITLDEMAEKLYNAEMKEKSREQRDTNIVPYNQLTNEESLIFRAVAQETMKKLDDILPPVLYLKNETDNISSEDVKIDLFSDEWEIVEQNN